MLIKFRDFFANEKVFLGSAILAVGGYLLNAFKVLIISKLYFIAFSSFAFAICIIIMYTSYIHHEKNVMKGIIGLFLGFLIIYNANVAFTSISDFIISSIPFSAIGVSSIVSLVVSILFTINHFLINSDHHSNPTRVYFNQLLIIVNAIVSIVVFGSVVAMHISNGSSMLNIILTIVSGLGSAVSYNVVACIETRLDVYRVQREANGWKLEDSK